MVRTSSTLTLATTREAAQAPATSASYFFCGKVRYFAFHYLSSKNSSCLITTITMIIMRITITPVAMNTKKTVTMITLSPLWQVP